MQTPQLESELSPEYLHKKSRTDVLLTFDLGSGGRIRTDDLRVMSPTSYHCSTPHSLISLAEIGCKGTNIFQIYQIFLSINLLLLDYLLFIDCISGVDNHGISAGRESFKRDFGAITSNFALYDNTSPRVNDIQSDILGRGEGKV